MQGERAIIIAVLCLLLGLAIGTTINGSNQMIGSFYHAEGYYHNHEGTPLDFDAEAYYYTLFFDGTHLYGFTCTDNQNLTCTVSGTYLVNFQACGSGQNNHEYVLGVAINGEVDYNTEVHKKMSAGGDVTPMSGTGIITLTKGDKVTLKITDASGVGEGYYIGSNLNLVYIGV